MGEAFVYNIMGRGNDGALDRVLNAPTNEAWIDPWVAHAAQARRALPRRARRSTALRVRKGRIDGARARSTAAAAAGASRPTGSSPRCRSSARASCSTRSCSRLDPSLEGMHDLFYDWMNGIQFFLREPVDITHGHITFIDAPWALTALTQAQFWARPRLRARLRRRHGQVDCLSRRHLQLGRARDPLRQAGQAVHEGGGRARGAGRRSSEHKTAADKLPDDIVALVRSWTRRSAGTRKRGRNTNDDAAAGQHGRLVGEAPDRRATKIPNLFLAGDYVQTNIDLATMEGANESGRAAVNALLDAVGSKAERVADVQALPAAGVRGGQGGRRRALQGRAAQRA